MEQELIDKTTTVLNKAVKNMKLKGAEVIVDPYTFRPEVLFYVSWKMFREKTNREQSAYYQFNTKYYLNFPQFVERLGDVRFEQLMKENISDVIEKCKRDE